MKKSKTMENDKWKMIRLVLLVLTAGIPRILGAFLVYKEPFGDGYVYLEQVIMMRGKIVGGYMAIENLYSFWLPLYQFFCAIVSVVINQPIYVSKIVAALAGTGVCGLVYAFSYLLTSSQRVAAVAFLAIAFSPFHIEYSFSAMTDIPHALLVMACMYFVIKRRWTPAAVLGAAACLVRMESWMLVLLVPAIQFMRQRKWKLPLLTMLFVAAGPLLWAFVCWWTTKDPLASIHAHNEYMMQRLSAHPELARFSFERIQTNAGNLVYSMNVAVLVGCIAALWLLFREWRKAISKDDSKVTRLLTCAIFFFAYLGFIVFTFLTKNNTDIWHRYGLILFSLGLPILAYSAQHFLKQPATTAKAVFAIALSVGIGQLITQGGDLTRFVQQKTPAQAIASYLKKEYASDPSIRIFCDSPEVRILSGIPGDHFYHSFFDGIPKDREGFVEFLRANRIKFLMIPQENETSTPSQLFPPDQVRSTSMLEEVIPPPDDRRADSLYRVREMKAPSS